MNLKSNFCCDSYKSTVQILMIQLKGNLILMGLSQKAALWPFSIMALWPYTDECAKISLLTRWCFHMIQF